jgi:hypothetical protein
VVEIRQNDEHFVRAIVGIIPAVTNTRIEKVCHQTIRIPRHGILLFKYTGSLKFAKTFQFIARQPAKEIHNDVSIDRGSVSKKGTNKRRARGDSGQI